MPDIDNLSIKLSADAKAANKSLNGLITRLDKVSSNLGKISVGGLSRLSTSISGLSTAMRGINDIDSRKFKTLANNINELGTVDGSALQRAASGIGSISKALGNINMSQSAAQVTELVTGLSKLGSASVSKAPANISALSTSLKNMAKTLSKAPQINRNLIDMTNALARLSSQGSKVGTAAKSLKSSMNSYTSSVTKATKKTKSFASIMGTLNANFYWIRDLVNGLGDSVENAMDSMETINYFNKAFGAVADSADLSQWETLGYDSAEEYYNSFEKRAKKLTAKMSGFTLLDNGTFSSTGAVSLGMNPSDLMQYQAMFGQMSSSMGLSADNATKVSQALTQIGADLASVKNMDFESVWSDMASGLAGMSRTLDKYGVNIRNVNLQQKLTEIGIDANITALNQNDKALLRTIILLESTEYAWADLADTLNQPANQLRLIQSNLENLSRIIGSLFLPVVEKMLPYVNGLVIALQRLFTWLGSLLGVNMSSISNSIGSASDAASDLLGEIEDSASGLDDAVDSAKKLKQQLQGFDELNVISTKDDSSSTGSGLSGADNLLLNGAFDSVFDEYQRKWEEVSAKIENTAQRIADGIESKLQPIKDIISSFAIGDFFQAGQDASNLIVSLNTFLADAIDGVDWEGIGSKVGDFLKGIDWLKVLDGIAEIIARAINAKFSLWKGIFDAAPIETAIFTGINLLKFTGIGSLLGTKIGTAITKEAPLLLVGIKNGLVTSLNGLAAKILPYLSLSMSSLSPGMVGELGIAIERELTGTWLDTSTWTGFWKAIDDFGYDVVDAIGGAIQDAIIWIGIDFTGIMKEHFFTFDYLEWFKIAGDYFANIKEAFEENDWWGIGKDILYGIIAGINGTLTFFTEPITDIFNTVVDGIKDIFGIKSPAKAMKPIGENILLGIVKGFTSMSDEFTKSITEFFDLKVKPWFTKEKWKSIFGNIKLAFSDKWEDLKLWWNTTIFSFFQSVKRFFSVDIWKNNIGSIKDALKSKWDDLISWWNGLKLGFPDIAVPHFSISGGFSLKPLSVPQISVSYYAAGGFPDKSSLFFAGEHGIPEMLGTVGGKTAVAGGAEITGIRDAVQSASIREVELLRQQNQLLQAILEKEVGISSRDIFNSVRRSDREYSQRTGASAFAY